MEINVELPDADVAFIDEVARDLQLGSRSEVMERAVEALRKFVNENGLYLLAKEQWANRMTTPPDK